MLVHLSLLLLNPGLMVNLSLMVDSGLMIYLRLVVKPCLHVDLRLMIELRLSVYLSLAIHLDLVVDHSLLFQVGLAHLTLHDLSWRMWINYGVGFLGRFAWQGPIITTVIIVSWSQDHLDIWCSRHKFDTGFWFCLFSQFVVGLCVRIGF